MKEVVEWWFYHYFANAFFQQKFYPASRKKG